MADFIKEYVEEESEDGRFVVHDKGQGKDLSLQLKKVHRKRLVYLGKDKYFVCADFKGDDGALYDLDFFVRGDSADSLKVLPKKTSVHKKDKKPRYVWIEDDGVWKKKDVGATLESVKKRAEHPEHPEHPTH